MTKPSLHVSKLISKQWVSSKVLELVFSVPKDFNFLAGQFVSIKVNENKYRSYSIASTPDHKGEIVVLADAKHDGLASNYFRSLSIGDEIIFIGPSGRFVLPTDFKNHLLFLATGTGLAPFLSMLYVLLQGNVKSSIRLYFGVRHDLDIFYKHCLDYFKDTFEDFDYYICISKGSNIVDNLNGRISEHYELSDPQNTQVFLCGNPNMIQDELQVLKDKGISEDSIFFEKFTHSK